MGLMAKYRESMVPLGRILKVHQSGKSTIRTRLLLRLFQKDPMCPPLPGGKHGAIFLVEKDEDRIWGSPIATPQAILLALAASWQDLPRLQCRRLLLKLPFTDHQIDRARLRLLVPLPVSWRTLSLLLNLSEVPLGV